MDRTIFIGIVVCIIVIVGGIAAFIRNRYTRPNKRDVRLIASATLAVVVILVVGAYTLPQVTASPGKDPQKFPSPTGSTIIKIATDMPVSGFDKYGKGVENGAHLAIDQANAHRTIPGYTLVFDPKDDVGPSGTHDQAVGAANVTEFISDVSLLTQVASLHPDFIYFGGLDSTGGTLIRQQMQQIPGLQNLPYAGGDGIVDPAFATAIQPLGGGPVYGTVAVTDPSQNPKATSFQQQYAAAFPNEPSNV